MNAIRSAAVAAALFGAITFASAASAQDDDAGSRLGRTIERAIKADGPWLLPAEQALIDRKCGSTSSGRNGDSVTMNDGVLVCPNGQRIDDPEVRAMMAVASPRISRRVQEVMNSPAVKDALSAVSDGAVQRALEAVREAWPNRGSDRDR